MCQPQDDIKGTFESRELEATYCRDFACCGLILEDLHDLLQHYEECHVQIEEDEEEEGETEEESEEEAFDWSTPSSPILPEESMATLKKKAAAYLTDLYNNEEQPSSTMMIGKKRPADAMDILTQSAVKKIACNPLFADEDFLAQAGALLVSTNTALNEDKPYKCTVKGCDKAYKNPNGLKYHNQHGHCSMTADEAEGLSKPYQCTIGECGKRYKNLNGLKYHIEHSHMAALNQTLASFSSNLFTAMNQDDNVAFSNLF